MENLRKAAIWAVVLVVFIAFIVPVAISAGSVSESQRIWVHFNPKYFAEGNNLPVYGDQANQVGWLQAKTNPDNQDIIDVRWSWDGKLWTPPFSLSRLSRWPACGEAFRTDFIAFFSGIGLVFYTVDFGDIGAPEPNYVIS